MSGAPQEDGADEERRPHAWLWLIFAAVLLIVNVMLLVAPIGKHLKEYAAETVATLAKIDPARKTTAKMRFYEECGYSRWRALKFSDVVDDCVWAKMQADEKAHPEDARDGPAGILFIVGLVVAGLFEDGLRRFLQRRFPDPPVWGFVLLAIVHVAALVAILVGTTFVARWVLILLMALLGVVAGFLIWVQLALSAILATALHAYHVYAGVKEVRHHSKKLRS